MISLRWILMFVVLLQKDATTTSIAEEINFEVSNVREESVENDPQPAYTLPESTEGEPEEPAREEQIDDIETSQSELVETHVPPEESEPDELNAPAKRPRRRRRRRRRKRPKPTASPEDLEPYFTVPEEEAKRKPAKYRPPDEAEEPAAPDSSTMPRRRNAKRRRRPLKRPLAIVEDYPATAEGSVAVVENNTDHNHPPEPPPPFDHHPRDDAPRNTQPEIPPVNDAPDAEIPPSKPNLPTTARKMNVKKEHEPLYALFKDPTKGLLHPKESDFTKPPVHVDEPPRKAQQPFNKEPHDENEYSVTNAVDAKTKTKEAPPSDVRKENDATHDERAPNPRRRKRPSHKSEPAASAAEPPKRELEPKAAESVDAKNQVQAIRKNEIKSDDEAKINIVEQRKYKIDERIKQRNNETSKKDVFKLRRLPPISVILRHAKNRPPNETTTRAPAKTDAPRIRESISNEILTHAATLDLDQRLVNETDDEEAETRFPSISPPSTTSTVRTLKTEPPSTTTTTHRPPNRTNPFEFPIITYTEQRYKHSTTAIPSTTSTPTANGTAFIYIPCNQTNTDDPRNTFNENEDDHIGVKIVDSIKTTEKFVQNPTTTTTATTTTTTTTDSTNLFDPTAIKQLEKLLQAEMETVTATVESVNETKPKSTTARTSTLLQQLDASALESELDYLFQNGGLAAATTATTPRKETKPFTEANYREAKWFHDSSRYRHPLHDDRIPAPPAEKTNNNIYNNKEIVLSYTSSLPPTSFNEIDPHEILQGNELSLQLRNNSYRRASPDGVLHKNKNHSERKKLPLAVKSAIIISGAILALAVLGFFALLLSCKIRQAKSRMKCHRELYRERFQNSEFRQSSRSTSPVVSKSNYNTRNFPNNIQSNVASNRNYYLWQTLRKTFQYD